MFNSSKAVRRSILFTGLILALAICFETLQQLYYIKKYNIGDATFLGLFKEQASRWIIWLILGSSLIVYVRKNVDRFTFGIPDILKYIAYIVFLVLLNITFITLIQIWMNGESISLTLFFSEYFPFYIYQKAPIFTLGYIAVTVILYFYYSNEKLQIKIEKLHELKETHRQLYEELRSQIDDRTSVLSIKIGNKRRVVPVSEIIWIEADDYCAKIHLVSGKSYTMRSSLKNLEETLREPFMRVHRQAIVNMSMIKELNTYESPSLILNNNEEVAVSKRNLKAIKNYFS